MRQRAAAHAVYGHREPKPSVLAKRIYQQCKRSLDGKALTVNGKSAVVKVTPLRGNIRLESVLSDVHQGPGGTEHGAVGVSFDIFVERTGIPMPLGRERLGAHENVHTRMFGYVYVSIATQMQEDPGHILTDHFDIDIQKHGHVPDDVTRCLKGSMSEAALGIA
jgi:hypothetical protein